MRTAVTYAPNDTRLENVPTPVPGPGDLLLRVQACFLGPSNENQRLLDKKSPTVLGRGPVGYVIDKGQSVSKFNQGDRVYVPYHIPYLTDQGSPNNLQAPPLSRWTSLDPGGFSEFLRVPADHLAMDAVLPLPSQLSILEACFLDVLGPVCQSLGNPTLTDRWLIIGLDTRGLLSINLLINHVEQVFAWDPNPQRCSHARALGAQTLDPKQPQQSLTDLSHNLGITHCLFLAGSTTDLEMGLNALTHRGKLIIASLVDDDKLLAISPRQLFEMELSVSVSQGSSREALLSALNKIQHKAVDLSAFPLPTVNMDQSPEIITRSFQDPSWLGAIILPNGGFQQTTD